MKNKKLYISLSISALVLISGIIALVFLTGNKSNKDSTSRDDKNVDPNKVGDKVLGDASFPLGLGSKGTNVTNVNIALGLAPSSEFTSATLAALQSKFGKTQVTESDYNSIKNLINKY